MQTRLLFLFRDSGRNRNPEQWPDQNRYVEGIFKRLCCLHQRFKITQESTVSHWNLILSDYNWIRDFVLCNFR